MDSNVDFMYSLLYIQNLHAPKTRFFFFDSCDINAKEMTSFGFHVSIQFSNSGIRSSPFMIELLIRACLCLRPQLDFSLFLSFCLR